MRILCICSHGNVRSVALAYLLKTIYNHEAIAIGRKTTSDKTMLMLIDWADKIIVLDSDIPLKQPEYNPLQGDKVIFLNVGEDVWHNPFAQELQHKLLKQINSLFDNPTKS